MILKDLGTCGGMSREDIVTYAVRGARALERDQGLDFSERHAFKLIVGAIEREECRLKAEVGRATA